MGIEGERGSVVSLRIQCFPVRISSIVLFCRVNRESMARMVNLEYLERWVDPESR